jgi:CRISPR-associated protein Csx14
MNPTIEMAVDVSNPGQVFACCGIFELVHRIVMGERRALGWFEDIDKVHTKFLIEAYDHNNDPLKINNILQKLKECEIKELEYNDKEGPLLIGKPFNFIIDWRGPYPQNSCVKTWAAQQRISSITKMLRDAIPDDPLIDESMLEHTAFLSKRVTSFDASNSQNKIDVGFSFDKLKKAGLEYSLPVFFYTELFALFGLQRFIPASSSTRRYQRYYYIWKEPLDIINASSSITILNEELSTNKYSFNLYLRESRGRYKSFALAKMENMEVEI